MLSAAALASSSARLRYSAVMAATAISATKACALQANGSDPPSMRTRPNAVCSRAQESNLSGDEVGQHGGKGGGDKKSGALAENSTQAE